MKIPARRYQLALFYSLVALCGFGVAAHRLLDGAGGVSSPSGKESAPTTTARKESAETTLTPAQSGGSYNLTQSVIPGGGGTSAGGGYNNTGSIGQPVLGVSSGGSFSLSGGFWGGGACAAITVNPASTTLPAGTVGASYTQSFTQTGVAGTLTWSRTGTLPAGLSLDSTTGVLSGTPAQPGNFNLTVRATDGSGCFGERAYTLAINCQTITVNAPALNTGTVGAAFSATFTQTGGSGATTFSTASALPNGITLSAAGLLSGTPSAAGTFTITVRATDVNGCSGTANYTLTINSASVPTIVSLIPASATAGGAAFTLTVNGTGFINSSVARWNNSDRATSFVSATQLRAAIPATDIAAVGTANVTVFTPGVGTTSALPFAILNPVASVSAASFLGQEIAQESIIAAFGANLATSVAVADTLPLPTTLAGTRVLVRDSLGVERLAPLFFVAPSQINYQMPPGTATGAATVTVTSGNGAVSLGTVQVSGVAPGLFAANANGQGVPAANLFRLTANGQQIIETVAQFQGGAFVPVPIELGPAGEQVYLILYGTGFRGRSSLATITARVGGANVDVLFAGAQGDFVGLDQMNIGPLPRSLAGRGNADLVITVDGKNANTVQVNIK